MALLVCLIPTTIGGLLSAIGIAGINRLTQYNVLAMSGRAVEAAGDINTLLLDKTGTITFGNRFANEFIPFEGHSEEEVGRAAMLSSLGDGTPGGPLHPRAGREAGPGGGGADGTRTVVPFTAETRMSGLDRNGESYRKGAADAIASYVAVHGEQPPDEYDAGGRVHRQAGLHPAGGGPQRRGASAWWS